MEELVFVEKDVIPDEKMTSAVLKDSFLFYQRIFKHLEKMRPNILTKWKYFGKKNGWLLKHLDTNRNIFFLVVYDGFFKMSFTFGDTVISQILSSDTICINVKNFLKNQKNTQRELPFFFL